MIDFPINIIFLKSLILKHLVLCKEIAAARHLHCAFAKPTLRIKFTGTYFADRGNSGKQQSYVFVYHLTLQKLCAFSDHPCWIQEARLPVRKEENIVLAEGLDCAVTQIRLTLKEYPCTSFPIGNDEQRKI